MPRVQRGKGTAISTRCSRAWIVLFWHQKRTRKVPAISTRWTHEKGAARPFQPQSRKAPYKKASRFAQRFFVFRHLKSLRDGRRPTAATAVCRCDPSREKVTPKSPRLRSNESPSGAFKRQNGLALARWRGFTPTSSAGFSELLIIKIIFR